MDKLAGPIYTGVVRKTTLVVDDDLVRQAAEALGTRGLKATVDRALREAVALAARREAIAQLREMHGLQLDDEAVMASAWR
jgi:Arc/MetJ family transcription regulator